MNTALETYKDRIADAAEAVNLAHLSYRAAVQEIVDKHGYRLATGHCSDMWQIKRPRGREWKSEYDFPDDKIPEIFKELQELEDLGEDFRIGPTNMEFYKPRK